MVSQNNVVASFVKTELRVL